MYAAKKMITLQQYTRGWRNKLRLWKWIFQGAIAKKGLLNFPAPIDISFSFDRKQEAIITLVRSEDLDVLMEVLGYKRYKLPWNLSPKIIVDLGANIGISVLCFATQYSNAKIFAYEPNPLIFQRLIAHLRGFPQVQVFQEAVGSTEGSRHLYINRDSHLSSSLYLRHGTQEEYFVKTVSFEQVLERTGGFVDILKFDIEGGEREIFQSPEFVLQKVGCYVGELHGDLIGGAEVSNIIDTLTRIGYRVTTQPLGTQRFMLYALKAQ